MQDALLGEVYGYDGGKQVKGRKRQILVDSQGLLLAVVVSEANMPERLGGCALLLEAESEITNLSLIWVDRAKLGDPSGQSRLPRSQI